MASIKKNKKAQVFSIDILFGLVVFIFILLSAFWAWHITENRINYIRSIRDMTIVGKNSMNNLIYTPGDPVDWHIVDNENITKYVNTIGLLHGKSGIADMNKIDKLLNLSTDKYNETKKILGIIGPGYEYYITIGENKSGLYDKSARDVVVIDRAILLSNGSRVQINLKIWK